MSRLQEKLDFILNYEIGGAEDVGAVSDRLSKLNQEGTNVNEMTARSREIIQQRAQADRESAKATEQVTQKQFDMATAVKTSNDVVREVTLGMEILRLEFEQGNVSQDEYTSRLNQMRDRLNGLEVQTLSSVRSLRSVNAEQKKLGSTAGSATGSLRDNVFAMNSLARITQSLPRGIQSVSTQIPFLAGNIGRLSASAGSASGAVSGLVGFIASPIGMTVAIGALIPLVITGIKKIKEWTGEFIDFDKVAKDSTKSLLDFNKEILKTQGLAFGLFDTEGLQEQLRIAEELRDEQAERLNDLEQEQALLVANSAVGGRTAQSMERLRELNEEIAQRRANIQATDQAISEIRTEILTVEENLNTEVGKRLQQEKIEQQNIENRKEAMEQFEKDQREAREEFQGIVERDRERDAEAREAEADFRERAQQRFLEMLEERRQRQEAILQREMRFRNLLASPPPSQEETDESQFIENALTRQRLAEDARLALIRDSVTVEQFVRLQLQQEFEQERLELIRQGITDEKALSDLRISQKQREAEAILEIEKEKEKEKEAFARQVNDALLKLSDVAVEGLFENSKLAFQINKAMALSSAVVFGAKAVVEALPNIPRAVAVGAIAAAQIAAIASRKFEGGDSTQATSAERFNFDFGGIGSETTPASTERPIVNNVPDTLRLVDNAGRFLTELEFARDQAGDRPYLTERPGESSIVRG